MHRTVSFVKSSFRIIGFLTLLFAPIWTGVSLLVVAELIGIIEELV